MPKSQIKEESYATIKIQILLNSLKTNTYNSWGKKKATQVLPD
mgnify:CR=1 FL=1